MLLENNHTVSFAIFSLEDCTIEERPMPKTVRAWVQITLRPFLFAIELRSNALTTKQENYKKAA